jgi:hypothetical protein
MSSSSNKLSDIELKTFSKFNAFIHCDGYNPECHIIPTGYAEFTVEHQFGANPLAMWKCFVQNTVLMATQPLAQD